MHDRAEGFRLATKGRRLAPLTKTGAVAADAWHWRGVDSGKLGLQLEPAHFSNCAEVLCPELSAAIVKPGQTTPGVKGRDDGGHDPPASHGMACRSPS